MLYNHVIELVLNMIGIGGLCIWDGFVFEYVIWIVLLNSDCVCYYNKRIDYYHVLGCFEIRSGMLVCAVDCFQIRFGIWGCSVQGCFQTWSGLWVSTFGCFQIRCGMWVRSCAVSKNGFIHYYGNILFLKKIIF